LAQFLDKILAGFGPQEAPFDGEGALQVVGQAEQAAYVGSDFAARGGLSRRRQEVGVQAGFDTQVVACLVLKLRAEASQDHAGRSKLPTAIPLP
jgi:hypothetical protein